MASSPQVFLERIIYLELFCHVEQSQFSKLGKQKGKKSWPKFWDKKVLKIRVALCTLTGKKKKSSRADLNFGESFPCELKRRSSKVVFA